MTVETSFGTVPHLVSHFILSRLWVVCQFFLVGLNELYLSKGFFDSAIFH